MLVRVPKQCSLTPNTNAEFQKTNLEYLMKFFILYPCFRYCLQSASIYNIKKSGY